jgi:hypothetical protein
MSQVNPRAALASSHSDKPTCPVGQAHDRGTESLVKPAPRAARVCVARKAGVRVASSEGLAERGAAARAGGGRGAAGVIMLCNQMGARHISIYFAAWLQHFG